MGDPSYNRGDPSSEFSYPHLEEESSEYSIYRICLSPWLNVESAHPTSSYPDEYRDHLEPAGQELMTSSYIIDTSILTLSETNHMDGKILRTAVIFRKTQSSSRLGSDQHAN